MVLLLIVWIFPLLLKITMADELTEDIGSCQPIYINTNGSMLFSPNYPGNYSGNSLCDYYVTAPEGHYVGFIVHEIEIEFTSTCIMDSLSIYDGESTADILLAKLCGYTIMSPIFSDSRHMTFRFKSDSGTEGIGFWGQVFFKRGDTCSLSLTESGEITSPNFPANYNDMERCKYTVIAPDDKLVAITFYTFSLENSEGCISDAVTIYGGDTKNVTKLTSLCGSVNRRTFYSEGNKMVVEITSDTQNSSFGFNASFSFHDRHICKSVIDESGSTITSPNFPENYGNLQNCEYLIESGENQVVELTFSSFDTELDEWCAVDSVTIYDGSTDSSVILAQLCGSSLPGTITSTKNQLFIKFTTNDIITAPGFSAQVNFVKAPCLKCSTKDFYYDECPPDGPEPRMRQRIELQRYPPKGLLQCRTALGKLPSSLYHGTYYWMISTCPNGTDQSLSKNCTTDWNVMTEKGGNVSLEAPVVAGYDVLFKNRYCALCNNFPSYNEILIYSTCKECPFVYTYEVEQILEDEPASCSQVVSLSSARQCDPHKTDDEIACPGECKSCKKKVTALFGPLAEMREKVKKNICARGEVLREGKCIKMSSICAEHNFRYYAALEIDKSSYGCSYLKERSKICFERHLRHYELNAHKTLDAQIEDVLTFSLPWNETEQVSWLSTSGDDDTVVLQIPESFTSNVKWKEHLLSVFEAIVFSSNVSAKTCYLSCMKLIQFCKPNETELSLECNGVIEERTLDSSDEGFESTFGDFFDGNYWVGFATTLNVLDGNSSREKIISCNAVPSVVIEETKGSLWSSVCCVVAIISLLLAFIIYLAFPPLQNTFGIVVMVFVLSLAMAILCLEFISHLVTDIPWLCSSVAIITHWLWLSVFGWMTVLAYDLRQTFSAKNMRLAGRINCKKLLMYSQVGFCLPSLLVGTCVVCWMTGAVSVVYGSISGKECWIYGGIFALIVVSGPLLLAVGVNVVLFIQIIKGILAHKRSSKTANLHSTQEKGPFPELIVCIKISVLMGFTWLSGYIAPATGIRLFEYFFYGLLLIQGILIFIFFGANQRARRLWSRKLRLDRATSFITSSLSMTVMGTTNSSTQRDN